MKILNLMEGNSAVLFHFTTSSGILGIAKDGGVRLSDLAMDSRERAVANQTYGKTDGKLYYLSMARNKSNAYVHETFSFTACSMFIEFSRSTLSKYGKVIPVNFYNHNMSRGEMEDRLVSDEPYIPISDFAEVSVFVPRGVMSTHERDALKEISEHTRVKFYTKFSNFLRGVGDVEFDLDTTDRRKIFDRAVAFTGYPEATPRQKAISDVLRRFIEGDRDFSTEDKKWLKTLVNMNIQSFLSSLVQDPNLHLIKRKLRDTGRMEKHHVASNLKNVVEEIKQFLGDEIEN